MCLISASVIKFPRDIVAMLSDLEFFGQPTPAAPARQHIAGYVAMAVREPSRSLARALTRPLAPSTRSQQPSLRRYASGNTPDPLSEVESNTSLAASVPEDVVKSFDPIARAKARKSQLPKSRYVARSANPELRSVGWYMETDKPPIVINTDHPNTTMVLFILTDLPHRQTRHLEFSFQVRSRCLACSRLTSPPSLRISSPCAMFTTRPALSLLHQLIVSALGMNLLPTTRTDLSVDPVEVMS